MKKKEEDKPEKTVEDGFVIYDPDNLPYEKHCVCEILRDLSELTPEEIERYRKE